MEPRREAFAALSVLVVEPHEGTADALAGLLRLVGHRVAVARTGEATLCAAAAASPNAVLLELHLPDIDGWEVARRLQEVAGTGKRPLLVATTACTSADDHRRSAEAGVGLHLEKPIEPRVLVGVLARFARMLAPACRPSPAESR